MSNYINKNILKNRHYIWVSKLNYINCSNYTSSQKKNSKLLLNNAIDVWLCSLNMIT